MKTVTQNDYHQRILRVLVYIQSHLDHALDCGELASLAHFSPFHFHRVFRGMVGEPVMEHVRRLRLERSAHQLMTTDRAVTQIAFDAGYETHEAFTRAFRTMFDASPTQFREVHRRIPLRQVASGVHYSPGGKVEAFEALQEETHTMEVRIVEAKPMRVAFMRHVGPYDQVACTWQKFMTFAFTRGWFKAGTWVLAVVHDDPEITPPDRLRYDVCITVDDQFQPDGEVGVQETAGGRYAVTTHRGPYERLGDTYAKLMGRWLPANDEQPAHGPCLEVYLNNPQQTPPEDLLTEIHIPLARTMTGKRMNML